MEKIDISKEDLIEKIMEAGGNMSKVMKAFGVSRETIYKRVREFEVRDVIDAARIALRDKAIETIESDIDNVDTALKYLQFTRNLSSGVTISGDNLTINVNTPELKEDLDKFLE